MSLYRPLLFMLGAKLWEESLSEVLENKIWFVLFCFLENLSVFILNLNFQRLANMSTYSMPHNWKNNRVKQRSFHFIFFNPSSLSSLLPEQTSETISLVEKHTFSFQQLLISLFFFLLLLKVVNFDCFSFSIYCIVDLVVSFKMFSLIGKNVFTNQHSAAHQLGLQAENQPVPVTIHFAGAPLLWQTCFQTLRHI